MLTVRLVKYDRSGPGGEAAATASYAIREATAMHVDHQPGACTLLRLGDAPDTTGAFSIGDKGEYDVAYIMNAAGKTVDKVS